MKRILALCLTLSLVSGFIGCGPKADVKKDTTTTTTPEGATIVEETVTVEQPAETNPPPAETTPAPAETPAP